MARWAYSYLVSAPGRETETFHNYYGARARAYELLGEDLIVSIQRIIRAPAQHGEGRRSNYTRKPEGA